MNSQSRSPPAWSMGTSQRDTWKPSGQPGPGSYAPTMTNKPRALGGKQGTADREIKRKNSIPGPGSYDSPGKIGKKSPEYSIAMKFEDNQKSLSPGPGTYEGTGQRGYDTASPAYSFRIKPTESGNEKGPGPGAYEPTSRIQNTASPSYKIGSAGRDDFYPDSASPGPGAYNTIRPGSAGPKIGFGTERRDKQAKSDAPGPGAYEFKGFFEDGDGKGTSLVPRRENRPNTAAIPGPGAYDSILSTKSSAPAYRMGTAPRDGNGTSSSRQRSGTPGPGNYNPQLAKGSQTVRIGTSVRSPLSASSKNPGPGSYEFFSKVGEGPRFSMKPRRSERAAGDFAPGPGAYETASRIRNVASPSYKMGTSTRDDFNNKKTGDNPGPGAYGARPSSASGPKFGFGTSKRDPLHGMSKTLPGPGSYEQRSMFEGDRGVSLVSRRPDSAMRSTAKVPGPGAYNPSLSTKNQAPSYGMGSASRDGPTKSGGGGAPGPGNYEPRLWQSSQNIKIGTSVRSPLSASGKNPGPGTYDAGTKIGEGPQYSMRSGRRERSPNEFAPGPGAYSPSMDFVKNNNAAPKMGTGARDDLYDKRTNPGPGAYNRDSKIEGPKWGFGSEPKSQTPKAAGPGPGAYEHKSRIGNVPKYAYGNTPLKISL